MFHIYINEKIIKDVTDKLQNTSVCEEPFPHFFIDDFLSEPLRSEIVQCFRTAKFKTVIGGTPVSHICDDSNDVLVDFRDKLLNQSVIPYLDKLCLKYEPEKAREIRSENYIPHRQLNSSYGFLHLTKHNKGATIKVHRDDYWGSYQFIFFLGDIEGNAVETTELVYSNEELENLENAEFSKVRLKNYGKSKNGFLFFVNQPNAFHCLSKPVAVDRLTISGSILHFNWVAVNHM